MKKVIILAVFLVCSAIVGMKMNANLFSSYSLAMDNIEALAQTEGVPGGDYVSFDFDGTSWWGNPNGTSNFFPKYDICRDGGKNGHQVYCSKGDGNCWNGTSCIADK